MSVDVKDYKKWRLEDVQIYLRGLDDGRYSKYIDKLLAGFKEHGVSGSNLPELDGGDLRALGIGNFQDRRDLRAHF